MRIKVDVTQEDIDRGRVDETRCPVARAVRRSLGLKKDVQVNVTGFWITKASLKVKSYRLDTPLKVTNFVNKFDVSGKKAVKPFSFVLNLSKTEVKDINPKLLDNLV